MPAGKSAARWSPITTTTAALTALKQSIQALPTDGGQGMSTSEPSPSFRCPAKCRKICPEMANSHHPFLGPALAMRLARSRPGLAAVEARSAGGRRLDDRACAGRGGSRKTPSNSPRRVLASTTRSSGPAHVSGSNEAVAKLSRLAFDTAERLPHALLNWWMPDAHLVRTKLALRRWTRLSGKVARTRSSTICSTSGAMPGA